jgi:selenocysteine lyase/cysteine desulfurase
MNFYRRDFLRTAALGAAGLGLAGRTAAALPAFDENAPEAFWSAVRARYPLANGLTYFNTGGLGPAAAPVLARAAEVTQRLQENSEHGHELLAGAREIVARFLGAAPAEIAFVRNATEGNAIVAAGLTLAAGDEVIYESHAHPGGAFPWLQQQRRRGIVVRTFVPDADDAAGNVARIAALCTARTRVVQVSHVTAPTGIVMPVGAIARLCRERGLWFHIDGAQSAGMLPVALGALRCDSYATSGHKWLGGPLETGVLYVRGDRMDEVAPTLVGAHAAELEAGSGEFRLAAGALRYEYGTRNAAAVLGLAEAVRLQEAIGRERIATRGRQLAERVRAGLARLPGVEILTPRAVGSFAAMITFRTAAVAYDVLFSRLFKEHRIRCRPVTEEKLNALRVSTHVFNTPGQCDALIAAVAELSRR